MYNLYIVEQLSQREIAKKLNISQTQVRRELAKAGIKSRTLKESCSTPSCLKRKEELGQLFSKQYTKEHILTCQWCGAEFVVKGNNHKKQKFCSDECRKNSRQNKKISHITFCKLCGKEINGDNTKRYNRTYCNDCLAKWRTLIFTKKIKTSCGYCGKEIEVIPSRYNNNKFCYCSTECMALHYSELYTGENSPTWKGGKSHHYAGDFYKARKQARKRDNYTCQICGITEKEYGQQLSVHHIRLYRLFEDKREANNLNNLISVCEPCHRFIHSNANIEKIYLVEK